MRFAGRSNKFSFIPIRHGTRYWVIFIRKGDFDRLDISIDKYRKIKEKY